MGRAVLLVLLLIAGGVPFVRAQDTPTPDEYTFPETGHTVSGRFLQFWRNQGGLPVFGFPITERRQENTNGSTLDVQWFERERFERHAANEPPYDVLLGRLGAEALERAGRNWHAFPKGEPQDGCLWFEQTQHTLCEPFLGYWQQHGLEFDGQEGASYAESLALFGMPLSEPAMETNSSGATVLTQWFERARFEYVPTNEPPYDVLLGRLGSELLAPDAEPAEPDDTFDATPPDYHAVQQDGWPTPLEVPVGFTVEEIASTPHAPRFMALDSDGSLIYATQVPGSVVRLRDRDSDGYYETQQTIADNLPYAHSVAFINGNLYAAAESRVVRLSQFDTNGRARYVETVIEDIPAGARDLYGHRTRTLLEGPDDMLYLSVGSSCDVCENESPYRAAVLRTSIASLSQPVQASQMEVFASGLRNTVGMAFHPDTGELWGMDMGRNNLGPGLPPEELNQIKPYHHYGWPYCFGYRQPDPELGNAAFCERTEPPRYTFPAHWAPLGITFYAGAQFPERYQGNALIAFHGSADDQTSERRGYRVTHLRFKDGEPETHEDLLRGFIDSNNQPWARPAGLLVAPDGSLLVSDDHGGRIFRVRYVGDDG
jgi:glucose/arabinose dehydrogenase